MQIFIGESIEIPLNGVSRSGAPLEFLIRRKPEAGQLSEITSTGRSSAVVTYSHDPSSGPVVDHFRYAVRAPNTGVSTPAEVTVRVVERPSVFVAPKRLDFPDVALGDSARETLEIRNDGGGRITGQLAVPAPWRLAAGDGQYSLGEGDTASFTIVFTPTEDRRFTALGTFSEPAGSEFGLSGRGYAPIEVAPREVRLEGDGRNEVRTGGVLLRNVSDEDRELRITAPSEVVVQDMVKVAAKSETQVAMHTRAGFLGPLSGRLTIVGRAVRLDVPLKVASAPARLVVEPGVIDFGTLEAGKFGRAKLKLRNLGGSPAEMTVKLPPGVMLEPDPSYEALAPGAEREFEVAYARPAAAKLDDALIFEIGGITTSVPLKGKVTAEPGSDTSLPGASGVTPTVKMNDLPPVPQISFTQTKTSLELSWKKTAPEIKRYALILREIGFSPTGEAVFKYKQLPRVKPRIVRDEVRATLEGLRPGEHITLVVVGYDEAGTPTRPSAPFVVFTKPTVPIRIPWFWLGVAAIIGCVIVIVRERRQRRSASDAHAASLP